MNNENAVRYEVIDKVTEVVSPVERYETGDDGLTVHLADGTPILFTRVAEGGNELDFENELYAIRIVGTHEELDGTGTVEVKEEGIVTTDETVVDTTTEEVVPTVTE